MLLKHQELMIRKHIKVEPEQYYYYADSLGLMMWQDMVSGFAETWMIPSDRLFNRLSSIDQCL